MMSLRKENLSGRRRVSNQGRTLRVTADISRGRKASGPPYSVFLVPAGVLGETESEALPMFFTAKDNWCSYDDVPNEYIYECVKAIADADEL